MAGRFRSVRLNAAPRRSSPKTPKRPRNSRKGGDNSTVMVVIAVVLVVILLALVALYIELPQVEAYWNQRQHPVKEEHPQAVHSPVKPATKDDRLTKLQAKIEKEKAHEVVRSTTPPGAKPAPVVAAQAVPPPELVPHVPPPVVEPPPAPKPPPTPPAAVATTNDVEPPVAQPATAASNLNGPPSGPVRALPLDPTKLDTERIAAYQVALERIHFSCGFVDGNQGMRTQRMLRAFQASRGLSVTGILDQPTRDAIGEPGEPFLNYTVTADDIASIMPKPTTWKEKSQAPRLGYNDIWEMLAEKFHCTRGYLKELNHGVKEIIAGTELIGPKVYPAAPVPKAASIRILLSETSIEALDVSGKVIAFFPCSIAADKNKRPNGILAVKSIVPNPDYTFDPALFPDVSAREGLTKKMVLPPGPRNPVGTAWIGLTLPGYGMHGTPEPENISRTQSHGCFRLANWNAEKMLKLVKMGTVVDVQP